MKPNIQWSRSKSIIIYKWNAKYSIYKEITKSSSVSIKSWIEFTKKNNRKCIFKPTKLEQRVHFSIRSSFSFKVINKSNSILLLCLSLNTFCTIFSKMDRDEEVDYLKRGCRESLCQLQVEIVVLEAPKGDRNLEFCPIFLTCWLHSYREKIYGKRAGNCKARRTRLAGRNVVCGSKKVITKCHPSSIGYKNRNVYSGHVGLSNELAPPTQSPKMVGFLTSKETKSSEQFLGSKRSRQCYVIDLPDVSKTP